MGRSAAVRRRVCRDGNVNVRVGVRTRIRVRGRVRVRVRGSPHRPLEDGFALGQPSGLRLRLRLLRRRVGLRHRLRLVREPMALKRANSGGEPRLGHQ